MVSLIQMKKYSKLTDTGWLGVCGPMTDNTPIGGPIVMMNDANDIIRLMPNGSVEVVKEWSVLEKESEIK